MKVIKLTLGRLYNLGSYEHVRYDITVELADGDSAKDALIGLEKIIEALAPESKCCVSSRGELDRELVRVADLRKDLNSLSEEEFKRRHGFFEGTGKEYVKRCEQSHAENCSRRGKYETRARKARELLDRLGGAAEWKEAKLDWENDDEA
jgi:hypothetical protein